MSISDHPVGRRTLLRGSLLAGVGMGVLSPTLLSTRAQAADGLAQIPNPSFEQSTSKPGYPDGWGYGPSGATATGGLDDTIARTGQRSFRTDAPNAGDRYTVQLYMDPTLGGYTHRITVWHRVEGITGPGPSLQLYFYDADRKVTANTAAVGSTGTAGWAPLTVELAAPATSAYFTLTLANWYTNGTVWWDDVEAEFWVSAIPYGGNYLTAGKKDDLLTLGLSTSQPYALTTVDTFGTELTFTGPATLTARSGAIYTWTGTDVAWDDDAEAVVIQPDQPGSIAISGDFDPPAGQAFPAVTVQRDADPRGSTIYTIASGFSSPDHSAERAAVGADALASARRGSDYLETRVLSSGAIGIAHSTWPDDIQPDPQGNAAAANLNTRLWQVTGEQRYRTRATRILDFLVDVQLSSGGFGFPWAYGIAEGHFDHPGHYPDGKQHPRGSVMAIVTFNAAKALLEGYRAFGTAAYLDAVGKVFDYVLHDPDGLQFLDPDEEYASIPYCTMAPIDDEGGHATQVYNIDGAFLSLLTEYFEVANAGHLTRYGNALARNLARRIEPDGAITYAWYTSAKPTDYAAIVYAGLALWGAARHQTDWVAPARGGVSWMTNIDQPSAMLWENQTAALGGLDNTNDVIEFCRATVADQREDGSWTGGTATRTDAGSPSLLAALLVQMGYRA